MPLKLWARSQLNQLSAGKEKIFEGSRTVSLDQAVKGESGAEKYPEAGHVPDSTGRGSAAAAAVPARLGRPVLTQSLFTGTYTVPHFNGKDYYDGYHSTDTLFVFVHSVG